MPNAFGSGTGAADTFGNGIGAGRASSSDDRDGWGDGITGYGTGTGNGRGGREDDTAHHESRASRAALRTELRGRVAPARARVVAPLVDERGERDHSLEVRLVDSANAVPSSLSLADETRRSVEGALDDAWALLGAQGSRPADVFVDLTLPAALGFEQLRGRSLYLPTLLAAVSYWGDAPPMGRVIVTH